MQEINLITIFLTGLLAGGLSCLAVQGGLLATTIAQREDENLKNKIHKGNSLPILSFLFAKLVAYTILGLLLGWFGSFFELSFTAKLVMQFVVVGFMIGTALNLLEVHPIFRYFAIQPPKFLMRKVRNQSKSKDIFAPTILGGFTIFIPCGTTQAMMALAIASASPILGALVLFAFVLGTSPLFFILGYYATRLGDVMQKKFFKISAYAILFLALFNFNNALALTGSNLSLGKISKSILCSVSYCGKGSGEKDVQLVNEAIINIDSSGYSPRSIYVKAGSEVTLHLKNIDSYSCAQAFTIPNLGIQKLVTPGKSEDIKFTAPNEKGKISFMCSMGMYTGTIYVN
jgi:uncharacterized protein